MSIVFSGVQPTGNLHLGNYLGAIKQWIKLQNEYQSIFCIVDLHAITIHQNPEELRNNVLELTAAYIACGIDPKKAIIYPQSAVRQHSELAWILCCNTPYGWLNRMTQFKEKAGKNTEKVSLGLYNYPVLMAADILLYNASHVPVGDDQKQHLELTRDIAIRFNETYNTNHFIIPEPLILGDATRVMSLRDGTKKMSKSAESDNSRINLSDDAELIAKKFRKAKSDMEEGINYDIEKRPQASNLLTIYAALSEVTLKQAEAKFANSGFAEFKKELADIAVAKLSPINQRFNELKQDKTYLKEVLQEGQEKAGEIAEKNIKNIKEIIGL